MLHIAYCFDGKYEQHFGASLMSLLLNSRGSGTDLCIHAVTDSGNPALREKLSRLARIFKAGINLVLIKPEETLRFAGLPVTTTGQNYLSQAAWSRILLPKILPAGIQRVLYLDSDTIVRTDLKELFDIDMKGAPVAAAIDFCSEEMSARLQLKQYVNSGVLLIDARQWRKNGYVSRCLEHALKTREKNLYADQCAINTFFADKIFLLEQKWNRFVLAQESSLQPQEAAILHFITADKPWQAWYENPLSHLYWKYLDVSPWAGAKPELPQTIETARRLVRLLHSQGKGLEAVRLYESILASLNR